MVLSKFKLGIFSVMKEKEYHGTQLDSCQFLFPLSSFCGDRHLVDDTICVLCREWCLVQCGMGSHSDKSYESGAFADFRQRKKSNEGFMQDRLNNIRNAFTYVANLIVLVLGLVLFEVLSDPVLQFLIIALVAHILGILSSIFFLIFIKEK